MEISSDCAWGQPLGHPWALLLGYQWAEELWVASWVVQELALVHQLETLLGHLWALRLGIWLVLSSVVLLARHLVEQLVGLWELYWAKVWVRWLEILLVHCLVNP
jgi:hypothetical protein